jgi:hypothetical protein
MAHDRIGPVEQDISASPESLEQDARKSSDTSVFAVTWIGEYELFASWTALYDTYYTV